MKLIAVLAIVAVIFGNRAKATTPAGEAENSVPGTNVSTTPNPSSENSTTNVSTTPTPTNSTTNVTSTPNPTNSTTNVSTTPTPTNSTTNVTTTPNPTNSTTNVTITPNPTNSTTNVTTTPNPTNSTTNVTTTPNPTNSTTNVTTTPNPTSANSTTNGSTTPKPITIIPTPPPSPGEFSLKENGSYCILARFFAEFYITFRVNSGGGKTTEKTLNQTLRRGSNVTISGNCGSINGSTLVISWPKNESSYTLTMKFTNTSRNNWLLSLLTFNVAVDKIHDFANATVKGEVKSTYNGSQESSPHGQVGGSYLCNDTVPFVLNNTEKHFKVMATFQDFRVQPFANASMGNDFNKGTECTQDTTTAGPTTPKKPSDVIPIAVGCALAGLVLIVLIAYVIGRRKSHSGYEKV